MRGRALAFTLMLVFAAPARAEWNSFAIINWQDRDAAQLETLKRLGVNGQRIMADRDGTGIPLDRQTPAPRAAGLRWYIENIATDFYSSYHRYTPGKPVNWRFLEAQDRLRADPNDRNALFRDPSLLDQAWRARIATRLTATVAAQRQYHPLFYSLGDETGIADLSAYWDFDLSPVSVAGFRAWLQTQYGLLSALNAEWGTSYATWSAIQPETTRAAMRRTGDNFAAWNDFKAWMDTSFADALRYGTDTIHRADPTALSAIEGAQIPGWGGYDYTKLARAIDVIEGGDDQTRAIIGSINPNVIELTTSFAATPEELHRIWGAVLHGARGLILWDEDNSIVRQDASPGARGAAYAPLFAALRGDIGQRMIDARPIHDSVALLYSPVSFRVQWMLDHRPLGDAWMRRSAELELEDNAWRVALRDYTDALSRMGLSPGFITPEQLEKGPPHEKVLILPHAIALSASEMNAIRAYRGRVIADTPPGQFDEHGRRRATPPLPVEIVAPSDLAHAFPVVPAFQVRPPDNDVETCSFRSRGKRLLAIQRRQPGDGPETISIELRGWHARDIASGHDLGPADPLVLTLDPITPAFLELTR